MYFLTERKNSVTYNLEKEFDRLNKLLFGNVLQKTFPLIWSRSKNVMGMVRYVTNNQQVPVAITKFEISNFYEMTPQQFTDTMAHEMIHVYILQIERVAEKKHGRLFLSWMHKINKLGGFNISVTEDSSNITVDPDKKVKPIYVLTIDYLDRMGGGQKKSFALFRHYEPNDLSIFQHKLKYGWRIPKFTVTIYISKSPELYKHKISHDLLTIKSIYAMTNKQLLKVVNVKDLVTQVHKY